MAYSIYSVKQNKKFYYLHSSKLMNPMIKKFPFFFPLKYRLEPKFLNFSFLMPL